MKIFESFLLIYASKSTEELSFPESNNILLNFSICCSLLVISMEFFSQFFFRKADSISVQVCAL